MFIYFISQVSINVEILHHGDDETFAQQNKWF
jgi:hypothetical protein